jgi:NADPH:quinone reductase-like Zn-dependent oxidoreductase
LQLTEISNLIDAGKLRVFVENAFPFGRAQDAYARAQRGKMRGKIALSVAI